jgi:hypothetical protein
LPLSKIKPDSQDVMLATGQLSVVNAEEAPNTTDVECVIGFEQGEQSAAPGPAKVPLPQAT